MRGLLVAVLAAGTAGTAWAAEPDITVGKPAWLSSKPVKAGPSWTPAGQWPMCIAGLTPPGEDAGRVAALAAYRALYFQKAVGEDGLTAEAAGEAVAKTPKPPAFLVAACVKEVPSAADRAFRAAHPWARSYFDSTADRELFTPVPE